MCIETVKGLIYKDRHRDISLSQAIIKDKQLQFRLFLLAAIVIGFLVGMNMMPEQRSYHDESFHLPQIDAYTHGNYQFFQSNLTVIPGYHALVAALAKLTSSSGIDAYRIISSLLSAMALIFFYLSAKQLRHDSPLLSTAVFLFCPLFFPFFFVLYTDIIALSFVLAGLYFSLIKRYHTAGMILILSLTIRQTNVVWLAFFWAVIFFQEAGGIDNFSKYFDRDTLKKLTRFLIRTIFFPVGLALFLAFTFINKGVALGDAESHLLGKLYFTQIFFWIFVVSLVLLPLHITYIPRAYRLVKRSPEWLLFISAAFALYFLTFWADHHYNTVDFFIRNKLIIWLNQSDLNKIFIAIPMALAFLGLAVTPMRQKYFYLLYPAMLVSVLPHALIEQRYFMDTIALLFLFLHINKRKILVFTLALYVPVTAYLYSGISKIEFFL